MRATHSVARLIVGAAILGLLAGNIGAAKRHRAGTILAGNPGDCILEDGSFASEIGGCHDKAADGLVWSAGSYDQTGIKPVYYDSYSRTYPAIDYCANLAEGGYSDWRLPTAAERDAAAQRGGATHLSGINTPLSLMWTTDHKGKSTATAVRMRTDNTYVNASVTQNSNLPVNCVRSATP